MSVIPATQKAEAGEPLEPREAEVAVSQGFTTVLQPGPQNETQSQKNIKINDCYSKADPFPLFYYRKSLSLIN